MPLTTNKSQLPEPRGHGVAFLSSLVLHIVLLLILACWAYTAGLPSQGVMFSAHMDDSVATTFELVDDFDGQPEASDLEAEAVPEVGLAELEINLDSLLNEIKVADQAQLMPASLTSVRVRDATQGLKNGGRGRGASFFGTYAEGNRFVYVLDSSKSMKGDRWTYACNKLIDSIRGLKSGQEFFVLCFDSETSLLFDVQPHLARYVDANKGISDRVRRWLRSRTLGSSTMPAEALQFALRLGPDAIFLLSDGELRDNSLLMLRNVNVGIVHTPIHTVHLFSDRGRPTLEIIAQENGGTFTHVDGH